MATIANSSSNRRKSDLASLSSLGSDMEVAHGLRSITGQFGNVLHIHPLPARVQSGNKTICYLVVFDSDISALRASREMDCPMFGFTTVIVSIKKAEEALTVQTPIPVIPPVQFNAGNRGLQ